MILCGIGLLMDYCGADLFRDRDHDNDREFNDRDRDIGDRDFQDRHRDRAYERDRDRNREAQSLFCKDLNPQNQLDMEHVSMDCRSGFSMDFFSVECVEMIIDTMLRIIYCR